MLTLPPRASRLAGPSFFQQTGRGLGVRGPARYVGGQLFTRRGASLLLVGCLPEFCRAEARRFTASCPTLTAFVPHTHRFVPNSISARRVPWIGPVARSASRRRRPRSNALPDMKFSAE